MIVYKLEQYENASYYICVTDFGIFTDYKLVQL